jgi:glycerol-3-phosphate acyltransferase PlsX
MGADRGVGAVISGAEIALKRNSAIRYLLFGDQSDLEPLLRARPALASAAEVIHTDIWISMTERPSRALRRGRGRSSMWLAIDAVKRHAADVAISAGNTGALTAMGRLHLAMPAGVDRPAIAALWPTLRGDSVVLDLGASIGSEAHHLVQLAVMGAAMAQVLFDVSRPTVALLNIGVEEMKGLESIREAGRMLRERPFPDLEYIGFIEGHDVGMGVADVVVTEGFAGNIALKIAEGTAKQMVAYFKRAMSQTLLSRIAAAMARPSFSYVRDVMDANRRNGAVLLGLNGLVIKSHGNANDEGFARAIDVGHRIVRYRLLETISQTLRPHWSGLEGSEIGARAGEALDLE